MEKFSLKQLVSVLQKISLFPEEKRVMRERLLLHIRNNPVRSNTPQRLHIAKPAFFFTRLTNNLQFMPIILILALLVGGSVSYAAEGSLPGEALYAVKTNINESVRTIVAFSDEARASLEVSLASERLEEAEELAVTGKLDAETRAKVEKNFETHARGARERLTKLGEEKKFDAAMNVETKLDATLLVHEEILTDLGIEKKEIKDSVESIVVKVRAVSTNTGGEKATKTTLSMGARGDTSTSTHANVSSAEGRMGAAENKMEEVRKYLASRRDTVSAEIAAMADAKMKLAEHAFAEAKVKMEARSYDMAVTLFQSAMRLAEAAKLSLKVRSGLQINLHPQTGNTVFTTDEEIKEKKGTGSEDNKDDEKPQDKKESQEEGDIRGSLDADGEIKTGNTDVGVGAEIKTNLKLQINP